MGHLSRQQRDDTVDGVIDARGESEHRGQRINQPGSDIACESIGATEEHRSLRTQLDIFPGGVESAKLVGRDAPRPRLVGDEVVRSSAHECEIARSQRDRRFAPFGPEPYLPLDGRVDGKLDPGQPQPPRRVRRGARKHTPSGTRADQVLLQNIHTMSVSNKNLRVKIIEPSSAAANTCL
jgi:hypothetical protein